jgi:hypothetical protein
MNVREFVPTLACARCLVNGEAILTYPESARA